MKKLIYIALIALALNNRGYSQTITLPEKLAFSTAEGFGQNATGGRGGSIIYVTNLNESGSGSLRAAIETSGARIIIFRVGGTIDLANSRLTISNPNITIAGQTAPGGGIAIANGTLVIQASNVIIRHIRARSSYDNDDCIRIKHSGSGTLENIILDHVSVSWGKDGNLDISNGLNITVQNTLISKNIKSCLVNFDSKNISYIRNIFALVDQRVLRGNTIGHLDLTYEMINNYLYGVNVPGGPSQGLKTTTENNVCEKSNDFSISSSFLIDNIPPNPANGEPNTIENSYYYATGNDIGDAYSYQLRPTIASQYIFDVPLYRSSYTPLPIVGLKAKLLADTGAGALIPQGLDSHDLGIISNINSKTGTIAETGTLPTIASGTPYADSNNDGISDTWASLHGISSASEVKAEYEIDGKTVINDAEYTALEIFLAELAGDFDRLPLDDGPDPEIPVRNNEQKKAAATNILNW